MNNLSYSQYSKNPQREYGFGYNNYVQILETYSKSVENNDIEEPDETLEERLWGLTEMFPEGVRYVAENGSRFAIGAMKVAYKYACRVSWVIFITGAVLVAPIFIETERTQGKKLMESQEKQVPTGPGMVTVPQ